MHAAAAAADDDDVDDDDADWLDDDVGKSLDLPDDWSFADLLLGPWMITVYVIIGLIVLISSVLLYKNSRR